MKLVMSKRSKKEPKTRSGYQIHVSLRAKDTSNTADLTEKKLAKLAADHKDESVRKLAGKMLQDYVSGKIAVAWEDGIHPVYAFVNE